MELGRVLSASVTPVVLISACGLTTLALYNRLAVILARLRHCHQQQFELLKALDAESADAPDSQFTFLDEQVEMISWKARTVRRALFCLLGSVVSFLCCSILAALSVWFEPLSSVAVLSHLGGLILFIAGIGFAMRELVRSLSPLDQANEYLDAELAHYLTRLSAAKVDSRRAAESI